MLEPCQCIRGSVLAGHLVKSHSAEMEFVPLAESLVTHCGNIHLVLMHVGSFRRQH